MKTILVILVCAYIVKGQHPSLSCMDSCFISVSCDLRDFMLLAEYTNHFDRIKIHLSHYIGNIESYIRAFNMGITKLKYIIDEFNLRKLDVIDMKRVFTSIEPMLIQYLGERENLLQEGIVTLDKFILEEGLGKIEEIHSSLQTLVLHLTCIKRTHEDITDFRSMFVRCSEGGNPSALCNNYTDIVTSISLLGCNIRIYSAEQDEVLQKMSTFDAHFARVIDVLSIMDQVYNVKGRLAPIALPRDLGMWMKAEKMTMKIMEQLLTEIRNTLVINIDHFTRVLHHFRCEKTTNACGHMNGGCQHVCERHSDSGIVCKCYQGYVLREDAKSCEVESCDESGLALIPCMERVNATWTPGINSAFEEMGVFTFEQFSALAGSFPEASIPAPIRSKRQAVAIPDFFDARDKWPDCPTIKNIRNQMNCGSDWAVSVSHAASDRTCICTDTSSKPVLSSEDTLFCTQGTNGCNGGSQFKAWRFWEDSGIVTGGEMGSNYGCQPYEITSPCETACQAGYQSHYQNDKHHSESSYRVTDTANTLQIQMEIMARGPVTAAFRMYKDFMYYKRGIYENVGGHPTGGWHAMKIIGWGIEATDREIPKPYWLCANSFGENFGMNGFVKFLRGSNHLDIEKWVYAGWCEPRVTSSPTTASSSTTTSTTTTASTSTSSSTSSTTSTSPTTSTSSTTTSTPTPSTTTSSTTSSTTSTASTPTPSTTTTSPTTTTSTTTTASTPTPSTTTTSPTTTTSTSSTTSTASTPSTITHSPSTTTSTITTSTTSKSDFAQTLEIWQNRLNFMHYPAGVELTVTYKSIYWYFGAVGSITLINTYDANDNCGANSDVITFVHNSGESKVCGNTATAASYSAVWRGNSFTDLTIHFSAGHGLSGGSFDIQILVGHNPEWTITNAGNTQILDYRNVNYVK